MQITHQPDGFTPRTKKIAERKKGKAIQKSNPNHNTLREMIINQKEHFDPILKSQLQEYVYDVVGLIHEVYKELPNGLPEYIYQEALERVFEDGGLKPQKEYRHHPVFRGRPLESYLKLDLMIPRHRGNIIIECKAIEKLTNKEYQQLFSYMIGTGFPIGIIINFHSYPRILLHKFYYDHTDNTITAF